PTLRRWLDEDREWLRQHRQLSEDAEAWTAHQQEASFLYRGSRLAAVETWPEQHGDELSPLEQEFLQASLTEQARLAAEKVAQQRQEEQLIMERQTAVRLRRFSIALGVVFVLALLAALFALGQRQQAQTSLRVAQTAEADANRQTGERATAEALANERADALATAEALALTQAAAESQARGTAVAAQATTAALSQQLKVQQLTNLAQISEEADLKILLAIEAIGARTGCLMVCPWPHTRLFWMA
ncbi:MAG: hypothetical protein HC804_14600, partial [Anaerolineae bacterium]|nr:hypothetical protein [Anaerolineae bacterium]